MLKEKIGLLINIAPLKKACEAIEIAKPAKVAIEKACKELRPIVEGDTFSNIDDEIKAAITSIYHILETAEVGLNDESISPVFGYEKEPEP